MPFKPKPEYRGNRKSFKIHVRKDDLVQVISGSSKGTVGKVLQVFPKDSTIIVEGVNVKTKHIKPQADGESGQIITREFPIHSSKVLLYSEKEKTASRSAFTFTEDGKKVRMLKKTGEIIDSVKTDKK
ncbi:50S ribosomal protein L24 [Pseudanabaena sp. ABRG5-3]|uniref:50S ribosomal protein L24 n=1 Tax=Pseudanabaena sp. ABRG5-3 TaxID=685565 RepID=UPI000DC726D6|nr:50S ribosomal protein L24 [Pseudanabaena sp. ABRG5-3]BBC23034.1 50S ribosomal protein L24 [Pseudanabaena sp. ABRG5-3]